MKIILVFLIILSLLTGCRDHSTPTKNVQEFNSAETNILEETKLTEEKINNLALLGKIWGYLKYYHPTVAKGQIDWDQELVKMIPKVLQAEDLEERDRIFTKWIDGLGEYKKKGKLAKWIAGLKIEDYKQQPNLEWISTSGLDIGLVNELEGLIEAKRSNKNHYVTLDRTFKEPNVDNENPYAEMRYPEIEYRLLSLFRFWNIVEYYFPYKNIIDENWDDVLVDFIPRLIEAADVQDYQLTILELIASIKDSHAGLVDFSKTDELLYVFEVEEFWGLLYAPVVLTFVESMPVVTGYYDKPLGQHSGLKVGDVITEINGKSIEDIIEEKQKYIPASNYPTLLRFLSDKLLRSNDETIDIEFIRDDKLQQTTLNTYYFNNFNIAEYNPMKDYFKKINADIAYIDIGSLKEEHLPDVIKESKDTKGMIIDLRGYPIDHMATYTLGDYLLPTNQKYAQVANGSIQNPGVYKGGKLIFRKKNQNYYKGNVVILINELTISAAETLAMLYRTAPKATVIGSTTAAANGEVFFVPLPGGIEAKLTGNGMYNPDGSQTQRIGINPDIEVKPTIQGIKEGRDEVLERAVQLINENSLSD